MAHDSGLSDAEMAGGYPGDELGQDTCAEHGRLATVYLHGSPYCDECRPRQHFNTALQKAGPDMLAALKGIEADAYEALADMAADIQEGGKLNRAAHQKWSNVLAAIAKAEGR